MAVDPLIELYDINTYLGESHVPQDLDLDLDPAVGEGGTAVIAGLPGRPSPSG
ncbi:hypothetical protein ACFCYX_18500 [Streptomyces populi]|uniref:hypothetical protein n=1 Tax=Streptomyces populi TaxID=2058924 RepID=UPI0019D0A345|nr:hypothetical protein [Streptomyces populi]